MTSICELYNTVELIFFFVSTFLCRSFLICIFVLSSKWKQRQKNMYNINIYSIPVSAVLYVCSIVTCKPERWAACARSVTMKLLADAERASTLEMQIKFYRIFPRLASSKCKCLLFRMHLIISLQQRMFSVAECINTNVKKRATACCKRGDILGPSTELPSII